MLFAWKKWFFERIWHFNFVIRSGSIIINCKLSDKAQNGNILVLQENFIIVRYNFRLIKWLWSFEAQFCAIIWKDSVLSLISITITKRLSSNCKSLWKDYLIYKGKECFKITFVHTKQLTLQTSLKNTLKNSTL